jgi:AcrR family transcriptional regulator
MVQTGVDVVNRTGLTVSLDHLNLEEIIRLADVSRSAVYRRWPSKDLFVADLLKELAVGAVPGIERDELDLFRRVLRERGDGFGTPEARRDLITELFRELALLDFEVLRTSAGWRTYVALHATFLSLPGGGLREEVGAALAASQRAHVARVARSWEQLTQLFGYRLRPELGATWDALVHLLDATMRGLYVVSLATPEVAEQRLAAHPFGSAESRDWSLAAIGMTGIAMTFLEPDPAVDWTDDRVHAVRQLLADWTIPDA